MHTASRRIFPSSVNVAAFILAAVWPELLLEFAGVYELGGRTRNTLTVRIENAPAFGRVKQYATFGLTLTNRAELPPSAPRERRRCHPASWERSHQGSDRAAGR